eukprot:scaffold64092_cov39-Phaeocystis_antarctica.AAC.2
MGGLQQWLSSVAGCSGFEDLPRGWRSTTALPSAGASHRYIPVAKDSAKPTPGERGRQGRVRHGEPSTTAPPPAATGPTRATAAAGVTLTLTLTLTLTSLVRLSRCKWASAATRSAWSSGSSSAWSTASTRTACWRTLPRTGVTGRTCSSTRRTTSNISRARRRHGMLACRACAVREGVPGLTSERVRGTGARC